MRNRISPDFRLYTVVLLLGSLLFIGGCNITTTTKYDNISTANKVTISELYTDENKKIGGQNLAKGDGKQNQIDYNDKRQVIGHQSLYRGTNNTSNSILAQEVISTIENIKKQLNKEVKTIFKKDNVNRKQITILLQKMSNEVSQLEKIYHQEKDNIKKIKPGKEYDIGKQEDRDLMNLERKIKKKIANINFLNNINQFILHDGVKNILAKYKKKNIDLEGYLTVNNVNLLDHKGRENNIDKNNIDKKIISNIKNIILRKIKIMLDYSKDLQGQKKYAYKKTLYLNGNEVYYLIRSFEKKDGINYILDIKSIIKKLNEINNTPNGNVLVNNNKYIYVNIDRYLINIEDLSKLLLLSKLYKRGIIPNNYQLSLFIDENNIIHLDGVDISKLLCLLAVYNNADIVIPNIYGLYGIGTSLSNEDVVDNYIENLLCKKKIVRKK